MQALVPADRWVLQSASGDLDGDGRADHVLVLTDTADAGDRDLLIAFTSPDACGFTQKAMLPDSCPAGTSGGFRRDPIGEEGISGISIHGDSLVVHLFGGSAWKWEERSVYRYTRPQNDFFLVQEESGPITPPA